MRGDQPSKTKKAERLFFELTLNANFVTDVKKIRSLFMIPENGFSAKENVEKWIAQKEIYSLKLYEHHFHQEELLRKYGLPSTPDLMHLLEDYLLSNGLIKTTNDVGNLSFALQSASSEEIKRHGRPFVKLWIFEMASRENVLDYIRRHWKIIKFIQNENKAFKRISPVINKVLIQRALELDKLPIKNLRSIAKVSTGNKYYKYSVISRILNNDGYSTTEGSIKKLVQRHKKQMRGH